jgi:PKD domain-containing protein
METAYGLSLTTETKAGNAREFALRHALMARVNRQSVPSGLLPTCVHRMAELFALDGSDRAPAVTQKTFENLYFSLLAGSLKQDPKLHAGFQEDAATIRQAGHIPVYIADIQYDFLRMRYWALIHDYLESDTADLPDIPDASEALEAGASFFASTVIPTPQVDFTPLPERHFGLTASFVVPENGYRTNRNRSIVSMHFSFADGASYEAQVGQSIEHTFAASGSHLVTLTVETSDGASSVARFHLQVEEPSPWPEPAFWAFYDHSANPVTVGRAWVIYGMENGVRRTRLKKPLIISEGFPGNLPYDEFRTILNNSRFADRILEAGRDLIMLGFADGTRKIEDNAKLYVQCVQKAIREKNNTEKLICGGGSMGGLIARYALMTMAPAKHETALYFSVDTPHYGAHIPVSAQAFVHLFAQDKKGETARKYSAQMSSPAAQQMLLRWVPPFAEWQDGSYPARSKERDKFVKAMQDLGWLPQVPRRIVAANGRGDGVGNGVPMTGERPNRHVLGWTVNKDIYAELYSTELGGTEVTEIKNKRVSDKTYYWYVGQGEGLDSAPGGLKNTWRLICDGARCNHNKYPNHCFVPTVSACGMAEKNLFRNLSVSPPPESDFHSYHYSVDNTIHVFITADMVEYLLGEFRKVGSGSAAAES